MGETDKDLWRECVAGDADAFGVLFNRHADAVFRYCLSRCGSWHDAEELVSITFLEAWRQRNRLRPERDMGQMNPDGLTNDLIPAGFVDPPYGPPDGRPLPEGAGKDQNGKPLWPDPGIKAIGHYIPLLTECVVDNTVAVVPGGPEICARLGIPTVEK
ncbi:RNA polymerase sigma factor [Arthrobacter sp. MMS24-S77]